MIERVLDNLAVPDGRYTLIMQREQALAHPEFFQRLEDNYRCRFDWTVGVTEGACCTVLLAADTIDTNEPLLMANSDQLVDVDIADFIGDADRRGLDGSILTFPADETKWSYARVGGGGLVTEVREKEVISPHATVGLYYFRWGQDFVSCAREMIAADDRVNGEFYTCPVYNYAIRRGLRIGIYGIERTQMHGLGTPEDLDAYLAAQEVSVG